MDLFDLFFFTFLKYQQMDKRTKRARDVKRKFQEVLADTTDDELEICAHRSALVLEKNYFDSLKSLKEERMKAIRAVMPKKFN